MNFSKRPSLELNWLPLSDRKSMPTPHVVMVDNAEVGGFYSPRGLRADGDLECVPTNGERDIIVVSTHWGDERVASVLAHEFRHMQQRYLPSLPRIRLMPWIVNWQDDWEDKIRHFYRNRPWEMDALRYEYRFARCNDNEHVREVLSVL